MRRKPQWHVKVVLLLVGIALVVLFVHRIGARAIGAELSRVGPSAFLIIVPYGLGTALSAFPWSWLLPEASRPPSSALIAGRFAASGANSLLPFFGLAGEPTRLLWLPVEARAAGLAAIVVDRVLYNSGSALVLLLGSAISLYTQLPRFLSAAAAVTSLVILAVTLGALYSVAHFGVGTRLQGLLARVLGDAYREGHFGESVDAALQGLLKKPRRALARGLALHFVARLLIGLEVYVALWCLGSDASAKDALVLATVPIATALFASSIPSQIGVQEGAQAYTCAALGLPPALGVALVVLQRLRQLAFVSATPLLLALAKARSPVAVGAEAPPSS
jgi:uncharacterized protein (TIRG00374 family)